MKKEQLTIAKVLDKVKKYQKTGWVCNTNFLDPAEVAEIEPVVNKFPHCFYGGYEDAERKILVLGQEFGEESNNFDELKDFLKIISIESNSGRKLSHRNVLGSILGLGVNRDVIGDILISEERVDVFVIKDISKYILQNLDKVGSERVKVYKNSFDNILKNEDDYKEIKTTVASLRLDALVSASTGVSREISCKLIENQKVKLNYKVVENTSKQIKVGDKISVRGYGRIELVEILGETRKDRIRVVIKKSCN